MTSFHSFDLFSGIGGNAIAFSPFATPLLYCEVDETTANLLRGVMHRGHIATAPVHDDVCTLTQSEIYATARAAAAGRPLLVSGSWPCQGNSASGNRRGMEDERSGLLRVLCDVVEDCRADVFFAENTPLVVSNGSLDYLLERTKENYTVKWMHLTASELGYRHKRKRFFAVGIRNGFEMPALPGLETISARKEPARTVPGREPSRRAWLHALGNAVVPACSRFAFRTLAVGDAVRPEAEERSSLVFSSAFFTPSRVQGPSRRKLVILVGERIAALWMTPRASSNAPSNALTARSYHDLMTQVRFEAGTENREDPMSIEWVAWLMGYPDGFTVSG